MPVWRKQLGDLQADPESLLQRSSLAHIMDRLRSNPKVRILHNVDDFLAERNPSKRSKRRWATKWLSYPYGGHLGNIWYPENKKAVLRFFLPILDRKANRFGFDWIRRVSR